MLPPNAAGFARYKAIMVWSRSARDSACRLCAILVSVSPLATVTVEGIAPAASRAASAGAGDAAGALVAAATGAVSLDAAGAPEPEERCDRERRPDLGSGVGWDVAADEGDGAVVDSAPVAAALGAVCGLDALAVLGAVTGAEEPAFSPGVYTGGSSSTVYSRIRRPRAQLTSTRKVTNGSGMASVERTCRTSRPSLPLPTLKVSDDRNGGRAMPERVKASGGANAARSAVNSSGEAAIKSISAFSGSFNAEFKWISPRPSAHDEFDHKKDTDKRPANSVMRGIVTDISSPRILLGERLNFIAREELGSEISFAFNCL